MGVCATGWANISDSFFSLELCFGRGVFYHGLWILWFEVSKESQGEHRIHVFVIFGRVPVLC